MVSKACYSRYLLAKYMHLQFKAPITVAYSIPSIYSIQVCNSLPLQQDQRVEGIIQGMQQSHTGQMSMTFVVRHIEQQLSLTHSANPAYPSP